MACRKGENRVLTIYKPEQQAALTDHYQLQLTHSSLHALHRHFERFPASTAEVQATQTDSGSSLVPQLLPEALQSEQNGAYFGSGLLPSGCCARSTHMSIGMGDR